MNTGPAEAQPRIFYGWIVVVICLIGISMGPGAFTFAATGIFIGSFVEEFGWSRGDISLALTLVALSTALSMPITGRLVDRLGARRVLIPSLVIFAGCLALVPFANSLWQFYALFIAMGTIAAGSNSVPYVRVLASWFDRYRGLAIGIAGSGTGLGFAYVPLLVQYMISHHGWRSAYFLLAALVLLIALPLVLILLKEHPQDLGLRPDGQVLRSHNREATTGPHVHGLTLKETLAGRTFWILVLTFVGLAFVVYGLMPHMVPMLTDRGLSADEAARVASTFGLSAFGGRILIGFLVDRFFARNVALVFFAISAAGISLLAADTPVWLLFVAAAMVGGSLGAEVDLLAYLTSRYFGLRCFSEIFGALFSAILISMGIGPLVFGLAYDYTQTYGVLMMLGTGLCLFAILSILLLGPYPVWTQAKKTSDA